MNKFSNVHGGADFMGTAAHDFSTNANSIELPLNIVEKIQYANIQNYPDPEYIKLREMIAEKHKVDPSRILITGSSSEFIFRVSSYISKKAKQSNSVWFPVYSYGDYRSAAAVWNLQKVDTYEDADLVWLCDPSSPLGQKMEDLGKIISTVKSTQIMVLDCAYEPLRLEGTLELGKNELDKVWQMWSPNKALGMTGIRGSYVVSPVGSEGTVQRLKELASSWVLGAQGVELLSVWANPDTQDWLLGSLVALRQLKIEQMLICESIGWVVLPSVSNFFCVRPPMLDTQEYLKNLRKFDIKLRDTTSFGLPGYFRISVLQRDSQQKLLKAVSSLAGGIYGR